MAKKSSNKFGPQQIPAAVPVATGLQRPSLEKHVPTWAASFENASKVYQSFDMSLDIHIEPDWLRSVCERFQSDGDTDLARWIEQFADVCKELVRFKERLRDEAAGRWDEANQLALTVEVREQAVTTQQQTLERAAAALQSDKAELEREQQLFAKKKSELLDSERSLALREANAQAGFVEQNEQALRQLESRQRQLSQQHEAHLQQLQEEKRQLDSELTQTARRLAEIKYNCTEEEAERTRQLDRKRLANTPPRFFQLAAWCPPVFGGHHFKPLAEDLPCQANAAPIPNPSRPRSSMSVPSPVPRLPAWP